MSQLDEAKRQIDLPRYIAERWPASGARPGQSGTIRAAWRGDKTPSCSLYRNSGAWHWKDQASGAGGSIVDLLVEVDGLSQGDAITRTLELAGMPKVETATIMRARRPRVVATFDYCDEAGQLLFQAVRREPGANGKRKDFSQRRPDGKGGWLGWLGDVRLVLYRLPELVAADQAELVFITEGERHVDALRGLGFVATCNPMGAGKWRPGDKRHTGFGEALRGRHVVVLPDNDEPGRKHAENVAKALHGVAASVKVLALPELPAKGDILDWLAAGGTAAELRKLAGECALWAPAVSIKTDLPAAEPSKPCIQVVSAADLMATEFTEPRWAVPGLLPEGLTVLAGRPKMGKSWLALGLCLSVAYGGYALGRRDHAVEQGEALYVALEDNQRRLKARLIQMTQGQRIPTGLGFSCDIPRFDVGGLTAIADWLDAHPHARLVVVDTLARFRPPASRVGNAYEQDYQVLGALQQLAITKGVALVVVTHLRKQEGGDPFDAVTGSIAITGAADCTWVLARSRGAGDGVLHVTGRDVQEQELAMRFDPSCGAWSVLGAQAEVSIHETRRHLLEALLAADGPMSPKALAEELGLKPSNVKMTLRKLLDAGQVRKNERGHYYPANSVDPSDPLTREAETKAPSSLVRVSGRVNGAEISLTGDGTESMGQCPPAVPLTHQEAHGYAEYGPRVNPVNGVTACGYAGRAAEDLPGGALVSMARAFTVLPGGLAVEEGDA